MPLPQASQGPAKQDCLDCRDEWLELEALNPRGITTLAAAFPTYSGDGEMAAGKKKRAFIGNLRPRPNLDERLYHDLFVPHCLAVKNYPGSGITVVSPKTGGHREQTRTP
ncbi:hypothetical protein THAOC_01464, partial [Thalassiosira oceanica]